MLLQLLSIRSARSAKQKVFSIISGCIRLHQAASAQALPSSSVSNFDCPAQSNAQMRPTSFVEKSLHSRHRPEDFPSECLSNHLKSNDQLNHLINKFTRIWKSFRKPLFTGTKGSRRLCWALLRSQHLESKAISGLSPAQTHLPVRGCPRCNWNKSNMERRASNMIIKMTSGHF